MGALDSNFAAQLSGAHIDSAYIHVPFCTVRCGYCDFNTYTTGFGPGADRDTFDQSVLREIGIVDAVLAGVARGEAGARGGVASGGGVPGQDADYAETAPSSPTPLRTIYFGGGTPTLMPVRSFARIIDALGQTFGIADNAEISTEANPDTLQPQVIDGLARAGITRISMGMQSAVPHVLRTLDRTHDPAHLPEVVARVRDAGMDISVDVIYGTPGETFDDWKRTVDVVCDLGVDHISAYCLVIEPGTKMGAMRAHGQIPDVNPDDAADKYEYADKAFSKAGFHWYEISNWARVCPGDTPTSMRHMCVHNMAYWRDWNWWGFGPGAHSHIGDMRLWNKKHPGRYAADISTGHLAIEGGEQVDADARALEHIMLGIRMYEGVDAAGLDGGVVERLAGEGLIKRDGSRIYLTRRGRLMADYVTRELSR